MKNPSRNLHRFAWLTLWLILSGKASFAAPQSGGTPLPPLPPLPAQTSTENPPNPSELPSIGLSPIDPNSLIDDITPTQIIDSVIPPGPNPPQRTPPVTAPAAATPPAAPSSPAASSAASRLFARGSANTAAASTGGALTLNTVGDQGTISFASPGNKGPAISISRNFALNITDNNSAPLQNRLIPIEYYHFFDSNRVYPGLTFIPNRFAAAILPSQNSRTKVVTQDDRYVFGFEAIVAPRMSILFRQSVVTVQQPDVILQQGTKIHTLGGTRSGWSDLQISPKFLLYEDKKYTATAGVGTIIPLGENAPYHQFGNSAFVLEPFFLFLAKPTDRLVLQAGLEYDIPIANNLSHVSLFRYLLFAGYKIYDDPKNDYIKQVYPLIEFHGSDLVGGFTQDTVNFTAGVRVNAFRKSQFGVGYSVPVTQDRQFSNEVLFNYNIFF